MFFITLTLASVWFIKSRSNKNVAVPNSIWVQTMVVKESVMPLKANAIGTLVARSVEISPEIAGHIEKILFKDGTFVKKNDPLIQLDDAIYKAKNASAKAQLMYSQNDLKRKALLGKQGVVTKQAIDQAEADFKEKRANAQESAVMVSKMQLTAPFEGAIGKSKVNPGDYVTTGMGLVTLTDTNHLRVEYNLPEKYLPSLAINQAVTLTSAAYPGKKFHGKVSFISPTINTENRSVSLYAEVPNEAHLLAAGMFVNVFQNLGTAQHVIIIPARSVIPIMDGEQVYKVLEGKAYAVTILLGKRDMDNVQVIEGLSVGDQIITDGQLKVRNGLPVKIKT